MTADAENDGDRGGMSEINLLRAKCCRQLYELGDDDVRVLARVLDELPHGRLLAACETETDRGVRAHGDDTEMPTTSLLVRAMGELLGAMGAWRLVVGLPPLRARGADAVLRGSRRRP